MPFNLDAAIRKVPDFPRPGILFYDVTSILMSPEAYGYCTERLSSWVRELKPYAVAGIEARGFLFAAPVARGLGLPLVLVRKKGKLPGETLQKSFSLEYGQDTIEVHKADLPVGKPVVVIDDLVATGGTLKAACGLFTENGCPVAAVLAVVGLPFLNYAGFLGEIPVKTIIDYEGE